MFVLNVAEKPSVAKEISRILSAGQFQRRNGCSKYNPVFQFPAQIQGQQCTMIVTSVTGHLMERDFTGEFRNWNSCAPEALFSAPIEKCVRKDESAQNIVKTLKREVRKCQWLALWLDCDREGENIAFEVKSFCEQHRRNLRVTRATFSALIPAEIKRALQSMREPDARLSEAVEARMEIDLRLGAAFTRFQTKRLQNRFSGLDQSVISYGPCQFPTLGFVVDRHIRIENFVREDFWSIVVKHQQPGGAASSQHEPNEVVFTWKQNRLFDQYVCSMLYELCVESPLATITKVDKRNNTKRKPLPLSTVELQKRASRWLRLPSQRTMQVAEALYNRGIISYPRTETEKFKPETDLKSLIDQYRGHSAYGSYAQQLLDGGKFEWPRAGRNDDNAHPPIHPTKNVELNTLEGDEKKIYDLVSRHFLACCSLDAKGHETKVEIVVAREEFGTSGQMIMERNYLDIYKWDKWSAKTIPNYVAQGTFYPTAIDFTSGRTQPPSYLSEADLIAEMDRNGIGTDATIAEHINTILKRKYAFKDGTLFKPTPLGVALVQGYNEMGFELAKPHLRSEMERDCRDIAGGRKSRQQVVANCLRQMKQIFDLVCSRANILETLVSQHYASVDMSAITESAAVVIQSFSKCGNCQGMMKLCKRASDRPLFFLNCVQCQHTYQLPAREQFEPQAEECPLCHFQVVRVCHGNGYSICPHCYSSPPRSDIEPPMPCFKCHADCPLASSSSMETVMKCRSCAKSCVVKKTRNGKWVVGCTGYPDCTVPSVWLPSATQKVVVDPEAKCRSCSSPNNSVALLQCTFSPGSVPPHLESPYIACCLCDSELQNLSDFDGGPGLRITHERTSTLSSSPSMNPHQLDHSYRQLHQSVQPPSSGRSSIVMGHPLAGSRGDLRGPVGQGQLPRMQVRNTSSGPSSIAPNNQLQESVCPQCECGNPAIELTSRSSNNPNRKFYKCAARDPDARCTYFQWADEVNQSIQQKTTRSNARVQSASASRQDVPSCECGVEAIVRTSRSEKNPNRDFFVCNTATKCDFFQWADERSSQLPQCDCGIPAVERTARSAKNNGRKFLACSKPQNQQCDYFQWLDQVPS